MIEQDVKPWHRRATFCAIAIIYLALPNIYPRFMSPNEYARLWTAQAILEHGSLQIDSFVGNRPPDSVSDIAFFRGHFYGDKAIGMSLASIPPLALLRLVVPRASILTLLFAARLFSVTIPGLIALWFVLERCESRFAILTVIGLCLGSVIFPQSLGLTGHLPMTIAICTAAVLLSGIDLSDARAALAGALAGAAILIDFTSGIAAIGLLIVLAWRTRSIRKVVLFCICCTALASVQLYVNARCFDGPLDFAYHHEANPADRLNRAGTFFGIGAPRAEAVVGLTFGRMQGMFVHSPFLLLAIPALFVAISRRRQDPIRTWAVVMCAAYFCLNCTLADWIGGWSLGPRYLTLIYVLLAYLLVVWFDREATAKTRTYLQPLLLLGITWSVLLHLSAMLTWSMPPHWDFLTFPVMQLAGYLIFRGAFAPNLLAWSGVPVIVAMAVLLLLAFGVIILNGGKRSIPFVAIATLLFTIVLSRTAPPFESPIARQFDLFIHYMGQQ